MSHLCRRIVADAMRSGVSPPRFKGEVSPAAIRELIVILGRARANLLTDKAVRGERHQPVYAP